MTDTNEKLLLVPRNTTGQGDIGQGDIVQVDIVEVDKAQGAKQSKKTGYRPWLHTWMIASTILLTLVGFLAGVIFAAVTAENSLTNTSANHLTAENMYSLYLSSVAKIVVASCVGLISGGVVCSVALVIDKSCSATTDTASPNSAAAKTAYTSF